MGTDSAQVQLIANARYEIRMLLGSYLGSNASGVAVPGMLRHWIGRQSFRMVNCPRHHR